MSVFHVLESLESTGKANELFQLFLSENYKRVPQFKVMCAPCVQSVCDVPYTLQGKVDCELNSFLRLKG